jgi:hypothetical protein
VNEHTPLLLPPCRYSYARGYNEDYTVDEDVGRQRERVIDETFGKWPGRLLNRHVRSQVVTCTAWIAHVLSVVVVAS